MSNDKTRIGVVGCGFIAQLHLQGAAASDAVQVVAVADTREEAAKTTAENYGADWHTDADALIARDDVDGVVLALPTGVRGEIARAALAAGKHILIEKPPAMNADELQGLIDARGDLVAGCCSARNRFLPSAESITEFLVDRPLGDLRVVRVRAIDELGQAPEGPPAAWRLSRKLNGGGILTNWGSYDLDYLLGVTGWALRPEVAFAQTWGPMPGLDAYVAPGSDAETYYTALVRCADGVMLSLERGELMAAHAEASWEIIGTTGSLRFTMHSGAQVWHDKGVPGSGVESEVIWQGSSDWSVPHYRPVQDFAEAIRDGRPPMTTLENALTIQKIFDAVYASAAAGEAVRFS